MKQLIPKERKVIYQRNHNQQHISRVAWGQERACLVVTSAMLAMYKQSRL